MHTASWKGLRQGGVQGEQKYGWNKVCEAMEPEGHGRSAQVERTLASTWSERRTITLLLPQHHSSPEHHFLVLFIQPCWVHQAGHTAEHGMRQEVPWGAKRGLVVETRLEPAFWKHHQETFPWLTLLDSSGEYIGAVDTDHWSPQGTTGT